METKSRYEVISDLEEQKRNLIRERDGFQDQVKNREREIKNIKRALEDKEEDIEAFKTTLEQREATVTELIKGIDDSLKRFTDMSQSQKK